MDSIQLQATANGLRGDILRMITEAGSGHPGGSLSCIDILTALYFDVMKHDPANPKMDGRDWFFLAKGHAAPALYAVLAEAGYFPKEELMTLRKLGTRLQGHPDSNQVPGVEVSTGSLGQGLSIAAGTACGLKLDEKPGTVFAVLGDGECEEGQVWEAAMFAASKKLDNLVGFTDYNKLQIDGTVEQVNGIAPLSAKWEAFGWNVIDVKDGNDVEQVSAAVKAAKANRGSGKPTMVILNTLKGCGVQWIVDLGCGNHNTNVNEEQAAAAIAEIRGK